MASPRITANSAQRSPMTATPTAPSGGGDGRVADVLDDDAITADAGQHRRGRDAGLLEAVAQEPTQRLGVAGVGRLLFQPHGGALNLDRTVAHVGGDDVQVILVPVDCEE